MVLELYMPQCPLQEFLKQTAGPAPVSNSSGLRWGLTISISNKLDDGYMKVYITILSIFVMFEISILESIFQDKEKEIIEKSLDNIQFSFLNNKTLKKLGNRRKLLQPNTNKSL